MFSALVEEFLRMLSKRRYSIESKFSIFRDQCCRAWHYHGRYGFIASKELSLTVERNGNKMRF